MSDYAFIRLEDTTQKAFDLGESPEVNITYNQQIQLLPLNTKPYIQTTNRSEGVSLGSSVKAFFVDCNGIEHGIDDHFEYEALTDANSISQIIFRLAYLPTDHHSDLIYLKIQSDTNTYYSNKFRVTNDNSHKTSRIDYKDLRLLSATATNPIFTDAYDSVNLAFYFKGIVPKINSEIYTQITTSKETVSRSEINWLSKYYYRFADAWVWQRLVEALYSNNFYIECKRHGASSETVSYEDRIGLSNVSENEFTTQPFADDTIEIDDVYVVAPDTIDYFFDDDNYPTQGALQSVIQFNENRFVINRHLGNNDWNEYTLANEGEVVPGVDTPWKVVLQRIYKIYGYLIVTDGVKSGTWSDFNSNDPSNYIAHTSTRSFNEDDTLTFTATFGGDLDIFYVGDTDGGIMGVTIDGGEEIEVDTYSSTANDYRQSARVATGLTTTSHTIVVRVTGESNPESTNDQVWFNAFRIQDSTATPVNNLEKLILWETGVSVLQYDERYGTNNQIYVAQSSGTTGATIPSHASGTVSDGNIDWLRISKTSFEVSENVIQALGSTSTFASASELEYAYEANYNGGGYQDIGGNLHENEYLTESPTLTIDGVETAYTEGFEGSGNRIEIDQSIIGYYGTDYITDRVDVMSTDQTHTFTIPKMQVRCIFRLSEEILFGYNYGAMYPLTAYHGATQRIQFERMFSQGADFDLHDYENVPDNPIIGNQPNYTACASGRLFNKAGSGGVPDPDDDPLGTMYSALRTTVETVDGFENSSTKCGLAVNTAQRDYTGFDSWAIKIYMTRYNLANMITLQAGQSYKTEGNYYCYLQYNE